VVLIGLAKKVSVPFLFSFLFSALAFGQTDNGDRLAAESRHAKELMADRKYAEAIPIYEHLVKAVPGNAGLLLNLALAEEMAGKPAQAIPHFEAVLKQQPNSVPALVSLSMARLQLNQTKEAIGPLRKLIAIQPNDLNAVGMLAGAELAQDRFSDAAEHYRELTVRSDADPRAWYGLGKAYEGLAGSSFERLNKSAPQSAYVAILLADTRLQRRQFRSAFFFYKEAQKMMPDLPGLHAGLAMVYRQTEHADWAGEEQRREASLAEPDCQLQTAECAFLSGHLLDAVKSVPATASAETLFWVTRAYNQLANLAFSHLSDLPESVQIHALKAQTFQDHRQPLEAVNEWKAALKMAPDDGQIKRELAAALFSAKDYQSVMPLAEELLTQAPNEAELNYLMGASLWRTEQADKGLPYLQSAVQEDGHLLPAEAALGLALVALDKNAEGIPHLKKALALDDDGSIHYSLARAYRAAGQTQLASEAMQVYQKIQKQNQDVNDELAKEAEISAPNESSGQK
jgi:tetratricopeptide (TPR) repeat protein